ncbi:hypothetical protein EAG_08933 [Camponotus floridanus]|uniref:Uncharacterized protein n=1 Tax=Camponotus floridanus TaxID=104421 RepID=E2AQL2_CAMFO|nr:hypothetical protein EAG_08933 [Camponotus floridanus]
MTSSAKILPCYGVRQFEGLTVFAGPFPHFAHRSDTIRPPISDEEGKEKWSSGELEGGRESAEMMICSRMHNLRGSKEADSRGG